MKTFLLSLTALLISLASFCQSGPELVFENPVLVSGTANTQGAVYRFSSVTTGVDAQIRLKKFSRNDIVMATVDNAALGWSKALQPEFGLSGLVPANQHWYIDFELVFYRAGTNIRQKMDTVDLTALDVDGDGHSISEYVTYSQPSSILYSTLTFLTNSPVGVLGQSFECGEDNISSPLIICLFCGGDGIYNGDECGECHGSGMKHTACGHAYEGGIGNTVTGPVNNFAAIDTSATQVMATYQFLNKDKINFRYGARSNSFSSNGAGIRLNSTWFREFSLAPYEPLPIKLLSFNAFLINNNKVDLKWKTASEINVSHFIIERSIDGATFNDAGMVFAAGNSATDNDYSLSDNVANITSPVVYYRLRSMDIDGKSQLSEVRVVRLAKQGQQNSLSILTFPNPVTNELRITNPASWQNKNITYEIFSLNGQLVSKSVRAGASQTETENVSKLQSGIYMVRASCEGQIANQRIVKH